MNEARAREGAGGWIAQGHGRELLRNHVWESLNAASKIFFFAVATPLMLRAWGAERFGLFALANSSVALLVLLDFGLRTLTRIGLSRPDFSEAVKTRLQAKNVAAFSCLALFSLAVIGLLALRGLWAHWLHLPAEGDGVIFWAAALALASMLVQLLLERIAARGALSHIKAALFAGNVLACAGVLTALALRAGVLASTLTYLGALGFPLLFLLPRAQLPFRRFFGELGTLQPAEIASAVRPGGWINVITAAWLLQSYGLVFLISWRINPAEAGVFFLFLKLSEFLSVLGASASEPTIAALAGAKDRAEQRTALSAGYRAAVALCSAGAVGCALFCSELFRLWLGLTLENRQLGLLIGAYGAATAFGRMVTAASLGLAKPRPAALGAMGGSLLVLAAAVWGYRWGGAGLVLAVGTVSTSLFLPAAFVVSRELGTDLWKLWLRPVVEVAPTLLTVLVICASSQLLPGLIIKLVAIVASLLVVLRCLLKEDKVAYDTRSRRSALVMRAIDALPSLRSARPFSWSGPCVVSSGAGLGDLFIHLPLIAGIVRECRNRGLEVRVALRPEHLAIGRACGWEVFPFDNSLEDFFKNRSQVSLSNLLRRVRTMRKDRSDLCIDLTGNAVSALLIKLAGARKLAARTTRGGRSVIDYPLPHEPGENEYANLQRIADSLGCALDHSVVRHLRGAPLPEVRDSILLCLTTICRWRNWPLRNFLALIDQFPAVEFILTGFRSEVAAEERELLEAMLARPNVVNRMDHLPLLELVRLIAHARAVVTNDTSTAHIANAFRKPGAVLFGPADPAKFGANFAMRNFVDRSCPLHPCVQWRCGNPTQWCMRKISAEEVAAHLATLLEPDYAAAAKVA